MGTSCKKEWPWYLQRGILFTCIAFTFVVSLPLLISIKKSIGVNRIPHSRYYSFYLKSAMSALLEQHHFPCILIGYPMEDFGRHQGEGGGSGGRGRVPGRTGRRSRCCGFAEVLGFFRAELYRTNIKLGELKMTAWSFWASLTKWDHLTRPCLWDIDCNVLKIAVFRQKGGFLVCVREAHAFQGHHCFVVYKLVPLYSGTKY